MKYSKTEKGWNITATSNWDVAILDLLENSDVLDDFTHYRESKTCISVSVENLPDSIEDYLTHLMEGFAKELCNEATYWRSKFTNKGRPREDEKKYGL